MALENRSTSLQLVLLTLAMIGLGLAVSYMVHWGF
jgi:hypothetical protein